ncbi:MAG: replicative DNA helicase [Treponema sp.]|jgi:replicative DNA helicase|nr:replicative DNA helicase [Treponema sp.]
MAVSLKDKVPPHNPDAEQAALGALLLDWDKVDEVAASLSPEYFYFQRNRIIYEAIFSLKQKGQPGDLFSLTEELRTSGSLEAVGGYAYVSSLTDTVPTSANIDYYAQIVQDDALRRNLILASAQITADAHDETREVSAILEEAGNRIFSIFNSHSTRDIRGVKEMVEETTAAIEKRIDSKDEFSGIPTGFKILDTMTDGFQNAEMIVVGARPSMGKTALALSMIQHMVMEKKISVGFFSLEMSGRSIMQRLFSMEARIDSKRIRNGMLSKSEIQTLLDAAGRWFDADGYLHIVDTPNNKLLNIRALARRMVSVHNVKIIFIDYIGLITLEEAAARVRPRFEQVAEISRSLKSLARELNIPIVALSQVNRESEKTKSGPGLADIRDSGAIEQDADVVILINDSDPRDKEEKDKALTVERTLQVAKQRNGETGPVKTTFLKSITRFENWTGREQ